MYWGLGIIGALCFGVGDWLLGYVDPGMVRENFSVIRTGHSMGYDLGRITLTLFTGAAGVPFLMAGCVRFAEMVTQARARKTCERLMRLLPVGWLIIHLTVCASIYVYAFSAQYGTQEMAEVMAEDMLLRMRPAQMVSYLFAGIPLVFLTVLVLRGQTVLSRRSLAFSPILWMAAVSVLPRILPVTPFINGMGTFCMNAGMLVFFLYLLLTDMERKA